MLSPETTRRISRFLEAILDDLPGGKKALSWWKRKCTA
jgi:hypothetical protein